MRSSKTYICHNTNLEFKDRWDTADKRGTVVINDWKNQYAFVIDFGKSPKVRVWKTKKNGDFIGYEIGKIKL